MNLSFDDACCLWVDSIYRKDALTALGGAAMVNGCAKQINPKMSSSITSQERWNSVIFLRAWADVLEKGLRELEG